MNIASRKWLRPALVVATAAIILALVIIQPWSTLLGPQNVIAKAYSAAESLQSYRMWCGSTKTTSHGEVSELTFEAEFMAPDRYHVKLVEGEEITEFILTGST